MTVRRIALLDADEKRHFSGEDGEGIRTVAEQSTRSGAKVLILSQSDTPLFVQMTAAKVLKTGKKSPLTEKQFGIHLLKAVLLT